MLVTVILCVLSTTTFCVCLRALLGLAGTRVAPALVVGSQFNVSARKVARNYAMGAVAILAVAAFAGAIHSYVELFQLNF